MSLVSAPLGVPTPPQERSRLFWILILSLLCGNGWLLTEAYPSQVPFPFAGCIHCALIAFVALVFCFRTVPNILVAHSRDCLSLVALCGTAILLLPSVALQLTAGGISSSDSASLFCAIPLMIVLASGRLAETSARGFLVPSLVGLSGALLLFPHETPNSTRRVLCFAAIAGCCVLIAVASLRLHAALRGVPIAIALALVGLSGALALGLCGLVLGWPVLTIRLLALEGLRCAVFDLPIMVLILWLAREVAPIRLSARFLLTPLVTVLEGYAFTRASIAWNQTVALVLIAAGSAMLLLRNERDESEELPSLRLR